LVINNKILDKIDIEILKILQDNCRLSLKKISLKLGMPRTTIHYRIKKLEEEGIIQGYYAKLNPTKLGKDYTTITFVRGKFGPKYHEKLGKLLAEIPGTVGVYFILGEQDFVVRCLSDNKTDFMRKLERLYDMKDVERASTMFVMKVIKEDPRIDLDSLSIL
jgi:DNA-binding Lrp family transcriptional regulator